MAAAAAAAPPVVLLTNFLVVARGISVWAGCVSVVVIDFLEAALLAHFLAALDLATVEGRKQNLF